MIKKQVIKKGLSGAEMVGAGVTVGAMALAGYLMFGPNAKKNRKVVRGWAVKMKGEIIEKIEQAKDVTEPVYNTIVDQVMEKYSKIKNIDQKELITLASDAKKHWKAMMKSKKVNKAKK